MGFLQEEEFDSKNHAATLTFVSPEAKKRSYFSWLPESVRDRLEEQPLTIENHQDGNTIEKFLGDSRLTRFFSVLTTTADRTGKVRSGCFVGGFYIISLIVFFQIFFVFVLLFGCFFLGGRFRLDYFRNLFLGDMSNVVYE